MPVDQDQPQRPPGRGNGLPADTYSAIADLDPRIADDVLITLHANGIAAYIEPTPSATGGYLEARLPTKPTDRLFADVNQVDRARDLVTAELAESEHAADDGALLPDDRPPWLRETSSPDDDHFRPPPPPPLPRLRPTTVGSLAAILLGIVIVVSGFDGGQFGFLGVIAIIGGIASLIWHMNDGPPTDSGWDDGAVL